MNNLLASYCTVPNLREVAGKLNYRVYESTRPYDLNTFIIRSEVQNAGRFDDIFVTFWKDGYGWASETYTITADPSDLALLNMKNPIGVAIVKPGQYPHSHIMSKHKGKYPAWCQNDTMTVIRDYNKDTLLDWNVPSLLGCVARVTKHWRGYLTEWLDPNGNVVWKEDTGVFGINIHHASIYQILEKIGLYSEGCTVFDYIKAYEEWMKISNKAVSIWGDKLTTTYITERQLINAIK